MAAERFVVLGLARPRAAWFRDVSQWATAAALPAEFVKCVSPEEVRARLASGRPFSAALLDGTVAAVDRDLLDECRLAGAVTIVVDEPARGAGWLSLGATAVLVPGFAREELVDVLATHAAMVGADATVTAEAGALDVALWRGLVASVCGPGGTGASTVAAALAQGLAADPLYAGAVVLADLCLRADQAVLHDVGDVAPGLQELVELHRGRLATAEEVRALTFDVVERRYRLLLGLRRAHHWTAVRPRAFEASLDALRRTFRVVVVDVTADFEGEDAGGSIEVEERNGMARTTTRRADVVLAVGLPGVKGLHSLVRLLGDLAELGVPARRIVPVVNQAPRSPRARAEMARVVAELAGPVLGGGLGSPVFLPVRRVEEAQRDAVRLPSPLAETVAGAFHATLSRAGGSAAALRAAATRTGVEGDGEPERVLPGSLGTWDDEVG